MLLEELLRPGDTFLDIGAHVGFFTVTIGLSSKTTKIIAFEPNPKNFQILEANTAANGLTNVVCEPIAISDQEGTGTLYLTESDMSASLMKDFSVEDTKQIGSKEVPTASLDGYLQRRQIGGPLVIKVDVEKESNDLWVVDIATGKSTRVSVSGERESAASPAWAPAAAPTSRRRRIKWRLKWRHMVAR